MSTTRIIMFMIHPQKSVELFHLLFLRSLNEKLEKSLYAVKGGCNLRFFFKSIRYSEDLDIDVKTIAKETLRNKIHKLFESSTFLQVLSSNQIEINNVSEAKQTDTTQRWKLSLKLSKIILPTKIEFSRRKLDEGVIFESVDHELTNRYGLYPILANHYIQQTAFFQKIDALIHRTETQARDIFDLHLLLARGVVSQNFPEFLQKNLDVAVKNALSIDFAAFKAQVVAFLMEEYQEYYNSSKIWEEIQTQVALVLEEARL